MDGHAFSLRDWMVNFTRDFFGNAIVLVDFFSKNMVIFFHLVADNHQNFYFQEEQVSVPLISV
jgi:hypothetical protein